MATADMEYMFKASNKLSDFKAKAKHSNGYNFDGGRLLDSVADDQDANKELIGCGQSRNRDLQTSVGGHWSYSSHSSKPPTILVDNCVDDAASSEQSAAAVSVEDSYSSQMNDTNESDCVTTRDGKEHSRLLRLLSDDAVESSFEQAAAFMPATLAEEMETFLPASPCLPGVRLRIRSRRAKDRIPSRLFRSLQQEFDSSIEDMTSPALVLSDQPFFRFPHLTPSLKTPETPSSATSELEGFFSHVKLQNDTN